MINWGALLGRFVSMLMSWMQASNLRTRVYELEDKNEILRTALEDIHRMDPNSNVGRYAKRVLENNNVR